MKQPILAPPPFLPLCLPPTHLARALIADVGEVKAGPKVREVGEYLGHDVVEQGPQLREVVLQRRACRGGESWLSGRVLPAVQGGEGRDTGYKHTQKRQV